jgi:hypothetical protein
VLCRGAPWLNEGLAAFFETMLVASGRLTIGRPTCSIKVHAGRRVLRSVIADGQRIWMRSMDRLPSLETMFGLTEWPTHDWRESALGMR